MAQIGDLIPNVHNRLLRLIWQRERDQQRDRIAGQTSSRLAVCAIFKDEKPYLREWIEFHRLIGVEKFFLYNNGSSDDYQSVLAPYLRSGLVELRDWKMRPGQMSAYNHCLIVNGSRSRWIAFLDIDEFLFSVAGMDLREVLSDFQDYAALAVHWVFFSASGHILSPEGLVIDNFRVARDQPNAHVKLIIDPTKIKWMSTPHEGLYWNGQYAVDEHRARVSSGHPTPATVDLLRINHYWSKSVQEYVLKKLQRGRADTHRKDQRHTLASFFRQETLNNVLTDTTILQYLPALKQALNESETPDAHRH